MNEEVLATEDEWCCECSGPIDIGEPMVAAAHGQWRHPECEGLWFT